MTTFLISGGRGLIGKTLSKTLKTQGHRVFKLTRKPKRKNHIYWDPEKQSIESEHLNEIEVIINLAGANIGEKKWSAKRKLELIKLYFVFNCIFCRFNNILNKSIFVSF